jgi:hypothetical protein
MLRSAISAFTRVFDALCLAAWCAADPGSITVVMGPGSAKHRFALHRVRDTRFPFLKYSTNNNADYEMASHRNAR